MSTITPYHAHYFAHELACRGAPDEVSRLSQSLMDAKVDLNPHQVEAALFALQNPLRKGVILADEVGLGKTIEAGLVLCQKWAERKRKLVVVCPAHIRKQWALELEEKFNLPSKIIDLKSYKDLQKRGAINPLDTGKIIILSYSFASRCRDELRQIPWDLVVFDEAHKLRNAYQPSKTMGHAIRWAFELRQKLLLTATPLQNSLLELYGLGWIIDDQIFGERGAFQSRYCNAGGDIAGLRTRLSQFCKRTLRKDVREYVNYTERRPLTQNFRPRPDESELAKRVQEFLQQDQSYALPDQQRHLVSMIAHKVLASSPSAVAGTLRAMKQRLEGMRDGLDEKDEESFLASLAQDEDLSVEDLHEYLDEAWQLEDDEEADKWEHPHKPDVIDPRRLSGEIKDIQSLIDLADSISIDSKAEALLKSLKTGFDEMARTGAARKALVFTESRRTQEFLVRFLEENGYRGRIVVFNGQNSSPQTSVIYENWQKRHQGSDRATGSRAVDIRTALVDEFRDKAEIFLATEAAAEGVNLQFCSLVINYDLPWNPQRIEQRIGRCHRYGQKHDVVVVNFLNEDNPADRRVQQLLQEKFHLFEGLFGASDEVLGAIESGIDFERRILSICRTCRTQADIEKAFDQLQQDLEAQIQSRMAQTRQQLLDNFDADVHERLRVRHSQAQLILDRLTRRFWALAHWGLEEHASFHGKDFSFKLNTSPSPAIPAGQYRLNAAQANEDAHVLRPSSPLGQWLQEQALSVELHCIELEFHLAAAELKISMLEPLKDQSGWLALEKLSLKAECDEEDHLLFTMIDDQGRNLDPEIAARIFDLPAQISPVSVPEKTIAARLEADMTRHREACIAKALEAGNKRFAEARRQIDAWADDLVKAAEDALDKSKAQLKAARRQAETSVNMQEQAAALAEIQKLDTAKRKARRHLEDVEDQCEERKQQFLAALKSKAAQQASHTQLFLVRWRLV